MTTRNRLLVITTIVALTFVALQLVTIEAIADRPILEYFSRSTILALVILPGFYWAINFNMKIERVVPVLLFPSIIIFTVSFFSELIIFASFAGVGQVPFLILSGIIIWFATYVTVLTANILNVSVITKIPLGQAGKAAQYVLTLFASYFGYTILFSLDIFPVLRLLLIFLFTLFLTYSSFWTIQLSKTQHLLSAMIVSVILLFAALVLSIWPLSVAYVALILSIIVYMTLGVGLEIRERVGFFIWIEYGLLFAIIVLIALLFAQFGINGTLI